MRTALALLGFLASVFAAHGGTAVCDPGIGEPGAYPALGIGIGLGVGFGPFKAGSGGSGPDTRAINSAAVGDSLTSGLDSTSPYPTQLTTMLAHCGASAGTVANVGHGGYTEPQLEALIATEVDPLWDGTKRNFLFEWFGVNDLYFGTPAAELMARVQAYNNALAHRWEFVVYILPTPRNNPGTPVPGINRIGAAPPAVTIGAAPAQGTSVEVDITTGGTNTTAIYTWKKNGVVQATGLTLAASLTLGGVTFTFPAGTYATDQYYLASAGYEVERAAFCALALASTFSGKVDKVLQLPDELFLSNAFNDSYYFYDPGSGSDQMVHLIYAGDALVADAVYEACAAQYADLGYNPAQFPWPTSYFSAATAGSCFVDAGVTPCTNGQTIQRANVTFSLEHSYYTQATAGTRPTYSGTGFGGKPAVQNVGGKWMQSDANLKLGRYTIASTIKFNAGAGGAILDFPIAGRDIRAYGLTGTGGAQWCLWDNAGGSAVSIKQTTTPIDDGNPHVLVATCRAGTHATHELWMDGVLVATTTYPSAGFDPGSVLVSGLAYLLGNAGDAGGVGMLGELYISSVPSNAHRVSRISRCLGAMRGITVP